MALIVLFFSGSCRNTPREGHYVVVGFTARTLNDGRQVQLTIIRSIVDNEQPADTVGILVSEDDPVSPYKIGDVIDRPGWEVTTDPSN